MLGPATVDELEGDCVVPLRSALLPGAPSIVYPDARHGQYLARDWYGAGRLVRDWWPTALDVWRAALRARLAEAA